MNDNGTPQVTPGQTVNVGNFNPDWIGGFTNSFSYKNLNLRLQIDIRQGGEVISFTRAVASSDGVLNNQPIAFTSLSFYTFHQRFYRLFDYLI